MNAPKKSTRDGVALWKAIQEIEINDDVDEIMSMSDAEVDAYIRDNGGDPAAIRASGRTLATELLERRHQNAWHVDMQRKNEAFRAVAAASRSKEKLPRAEIIERLQAARRDTRFASPVAALFRGKTAEAMTDDELQSLLDQIELLARGDASA
jgi:hypothetical protein